MASINGFNLPEETRGENKYIYGTYLESAFHNFFSVMRHIYFITLKKDIKIRLEEIIEDIKCDKCPYDIKDQRRGYYIKNGVPEDFGDLLYWDLFFIDLNSSKPEIRAKAIELFRKYFAFLEPFLDYSYKLDELDKDTLCFDILKKLSDLLRLMRHEYSHFYIEISGEQKKIFQENEKWLIGCLKRTFDASKRVVKERFSYTEKQMECAVRFKVENDFSNRDKFGRPSKKTVEIPNYKYKIDRSIDNGNVREWHLSSFGVVSFASLFLEKKYVQLFTDKLHCVKSADKVIINEMLSVYRLRLPVNKLDCKNDRVTLGLDMINELRKCPKDLFDVIAPEDQDRFRIINDSDSEIADALLVRNKDRFAYLLMKYIDENKLFKDVRFQVSLGKYFYKFYNKRCIDSNEKDRVRSLQKELNGFGRISEIEQERNIRWKELIRKADDVHQNTAEESPYITDHRASYVFNGNRIGLWFPTEEKIDMLFPEISADSAKCTAPSCWLSIYELPALAFLLYLSGGKQVEKVIKQSVYNYWKLFSDIAKGILVPNPDSVELENLIAKNYEGIKLKNIPKKLQDYLLCKNIDIESAFDSWARKYLQQLFERTNRQKDNFKNDRKMEGNKQNKIGKKHYVEIKAGRLAGFLAQDFMEFQPSVDSGKNKLTGMNFQILQASLATYQDGDFDSIYRLLHMAGLIGNADSAHDHPFLINVVNRHPKNIYDFYSEYLFAKINYLKGCLKSNSSLKSLCFLHSNRTKWNPRNEEFYRSLAARYLKDEYNGSFFDKSLELPRGLFEDSIRTNLSKIDNADMKAMADNKQLNIAYLIYAYFRNVVEDNCQDMYLYPRSYQLFNILFRERPTDPKVFKTIDEIYEMTQKRGQDKPLNGKIDKYISSLFLKPNERRIYRNLQEKQKKELEHLQACISSMKSTERVIKQYRVQDMLLFLFAKKILVESLGDDLGTAGKLEKMKLMNIDPLFNSLDINLPRFAVDVVAKSGSKKTIYQENLKFKNYGQFYRFLFDRRLPSLLNLTTENEIERSLLERELESYDRAHLDVLSDVFELEKEYLYNNPNKKTSKFRFNEVVSEEPNAKELKEIRNSFAHATYTSNLNEPKKADLPEKATSIRNKLKDFVDSKKNRCK